MTVLNCRTSVITRTPPDFLPELRKLILLLHNFPDPPEKVEGILR